jgi:hypothetical protein
MPMSIQLDYIIVSSAFFDLPPQDQALYGPDRCQYLFRHAVCATIGGKRRRFFSQPFADSPEVQADPVTGA